MLHTLFDGLDEPTKICKVCNEAKPFSMYSKASGGNYLRTECKPCTKTLVEDRSRAKASAPPVPKDHKCPICQRSEEEVKDKGGKKTGAWCCDHDHVKGHFRGWLCHECNRGIGNFKDSISRLQNAIDYLNK